MEEALRMQVFGNRLMRGAIIAVLAIWSSYAAAQPYDRSKVMPGPSFGVPAQTSTAAISGNLLINPSFEINGGAGSTVIPGWTIFNNDLFIGSFFAQTGTGSPLNGFPVPPPTDGAFAAMSDQGGPGLRVIYQDVFIPTGGASFSCDIFIHSFTPDFIVPSPETLDPTVFPNQHARIDIMDPAAPVDDVGAGVLQNIFFTNPGDPGTDGNPMTGYASVSAVTLIGGRTIRLRFAEVDNQLFFNMGIDNCVLVARIPAFAPAMSAGGLLALAVALLGAASALLARSRRRPSGAAV